MISDAGKERYNAIEYYIKLKTKNDALLHHNSDNEFIRGHCKRILTGEGITRQVDGIKLGDIYHSVPYWKKIQGKQSGIGKKVYNYEYKVEYLEKDYICLLMTDVDWEGWNGPAYMRDMKFNSIKEFKEWNERIKGKEKEYE